MALGSSNTGYSGQWWKIYYCWKIYCKYDLTRSTIKFRLRSAVFPRDNGKRWQRRSGTRPSENEWARKMFYVFSMLFKAYDCYNFYIKYFSDFLQLIHTTYPCNLSTIQIVNSLVSWFQVHDHRLHIITCPNQQSNEGIRAELSLQRSKSLLMSSDLFGGFLSMLSSWTKLLPRREDLGALHQKNKSVL